MYPFQGPTTVCVSGASGSGKTTWIAKLIKNRHQMLQPPVKKVIYFYAVWQDKFNHMKDVEFVKGLPDTFEPYACGHHVLVIIDDLINEAVDNKQVEFAFTTLSHHMLMTFCLLTQNVFQKGKSARTINLNSHVLVLFKNYRSNLQVLMLGREIFTGRSQILVQALDECTKERYNPLILDLSPHARDEHRLRSNVMPGEQTWIYEPLL